MACELRGSFEEVTEEEIVMVFKNQNGRKAEEEL